MNLKKEIETIHKEAEKKVGFPLPKEFWYGVEEDVGDVSGYFDGDPEGQKAYIESYRSVAKRYVMALKSVMPRIRERPLTTGNGKPFRLKKTYQKCSLRRSYLIDFVSDKGFNNKTNRIDWKRTVKEWNNTNPLDAMSLSVLKAAYYRAKKENMTREEFDQLCESLKKVAPTWKDVILLAEQAGNEADIEWRKAHRFEVH